MSGTQWVREEFTATEVHSGPSAPYRWQRYDGVVNAECRAGLQVLGLLDYSNTWGDGDHGTMPHADMARLSADFAAYAAAAARHYRGRIQYWELWNEPNLALYWHPTPNPDDYAVLVDAASRAIKRANPAARVVLGGTSGVDLDFIQAVAQRTNQFDVVAVHPYRLQPETQLLPQVTALRTLGKPVWFSEIGWPAGAECPCPDEEEQAHDLVRFYALSAAAGVQRIFWYDFRDDAQGAGVQETHFGLVRRDLSAKPSFDAYAFMSHTLSGTEFVHTDRFDVDGVYALQFRMGSRPIEILWNVGSSAQPVQIAWTGAQAVLVAEDGTVLDRIPAESGSITTLLPADGTPVYLLDREPAYHLPVDATRPLPTATRWIPATRTVSRRSSRNGPRPLQPTATALPPLHRQPHPTPERTMVLPTPRVLSTALERTLSPIPSVVNVTATPSPTATAELQLTPEAVTSTPESTTPSPTAVELSSQ